LFTDVSFRPMLIERHFMMDIEKLYVKKSKIAMKEVSERSGDQFNAF
jgi:hypothetical protein